MPMSKRRTFDPEFRRQAIALVLNSELTQTQISEELGISQSVLSRWVREHHRAQEESVDSDELTRLRRENERLKQECAFLKKAAGYFASTSSPGIK